MWSQCSPEHYLNGQGVCEQDAQDDTGKSSNLHVFSLMPCKTKQSCMEEARRHLHNNGFGFDTTLDTFERQCVPHLPKQP